MKWSFVRYRARFLLPHATVHHRLDQRASREPCLGRRLLVAAFALTVVGGGAAAEELRLSKTVQAGGIDSTQFEQPGSRIRRARAVGIVWQPMERVMQTVTDYNRYREFMPNFRASRVLARRGDRVFFYIEVTALHGLTTLWAEMRVRQLPSAEQSPVRVIVADMLCGNLRRFDAEWQIRPIDARRTLVTFELCADPEFPLPIPIGIVSDNNEKEARNSILGLRRFLARLRDDEGTASATH